MIAAYPLTWPPLFQRATRREAGRFKAPLAASLKNVQGSLPLFGTDSGKKLGDLVISSNVTLGVNKPADPGVAVWFTWDGLQVCIAVDRYSMVEGNLQAIHHIIEAPRRTPAWDAGIGARVISRLQGAAGAHWSNVARGLQVHGW
jgi:hypothetical protein